MTFPPTLAKILNIKSGEEKTVTLLFSFSFLLGLSVVFYETAAYSLFLSRYEATSLPYIYIGAAILIIICGSLYSYVESRFDFIHLMTGTLVMLGIGVILLLVYQQLDEDDISAAIIALWSDTIAMLVGFIFWSLSGRLLTLRQGKRLFSLVSTGEVIAGMVGGASIPLLIPSIGTPNLLLVSVGAFVACIIIFSFIASTYREALCRSDIEEEEDEDDTQEEGALSTSERKNELLHWRSRYMVLLTALAGFSLIGYYFVDYLFYGIAETRYPDEESLASFLGLFFAGVGVVNLIFKSLLAGRLMNRFGMIFGLLFLPAVILLGAVASIMAGWLSQDLALIFALLAMIKLLDTVGRLSVDEPSVIILYQPLPVDFRLLAQARIEAIGEPAASIVAGLLLIGIDQLGFLQTEHMLIFLAIVMVGWIITAVYVRREYWITLGNALSKRTLGSGIHLALDQHSLDVLYKHLESPHIGEVVYMLNLLEQEHEELLEEAFRNLLKRKEPEILMDVLGRIERLGMAGMEGPVRNLIRTTGNITVRGTAIRAFSAITESDIFEEVVPFLDDPSPVIRRNALIGLLRSGGIEGVLNAGEKFYSMVNSKDPRQRLLAADVLGDVGIRNFYRPLLILFRDRYREVRQAAFIAAGKLHNPRLWPPLVQALDNKQLRRTAEQALVTAGPSALPDLTKAFLDDKSSRQMRLATLRIIGHYPAHDIAELAFYAAAHNSPQIRHQALKALTQTRYQVETAGERQQLRNIIDTELRQATHLLITQRDLERKGEYPILVSDLRSKFQQVRARMFLILGVQFGRKQARQLEKNYMSENREKHAYALEILSNMLDQAQLTPIFWIFDDIPEPERLALLTDAFPQTGGSVEYHLKEIMLGNRPGTTFWTQCAAIFEVGRNKNTNLYPTIKQAILHDDRFVRETALWAVAQLNPITAPAVLETFTGDREPNVRKIAKHICRTLSEPS
jgi:HEAT repeat protein